MPSQTITLAVADLFTDTASQKQWRVSIQLDSDFEPGATDRYLRRIQARNDQGASSFRYRLFFDETGVAPQTETASDLVDDWETADVAMTFAQGSNTLDIPGPDNADNELRDSGDNYVWDPPIDHPALAEAFFFSLLDTSADLTVTFKFPGPDTSPTLAPVADQSATIGVPFSLTLGAATDGNAPLTYAATPLPAGFTFNATTRVISGTPTTAGTTIVTYSVEDDDGDTDSVTFDFAVAAVVTTSDFELLVDWENDGTYSHVQADVWGRVIADTFRCRRGRDFASQRTGRSLAGTLRAELDNRDGLLDPLNTNSSLYGLLAAGRRVRFRFEDGAGNMTTQWTGWLDDIKPMEPVSGLDRVELRALGVLSRLGRRINVDQQTAVTTGAAARLLFDPDGTIGNNPANVDGADYLAAAIKGSQTMDRWWVDDKPRLSALRELESTENGFVLERKDGVVGLQAGDGRTGVSARMSHIIFTDEYPLPGEIPALADGVNPDHPLQDLANRITSQLRTYTQANQQVLWSATGLTIPANDSLVIQARYPTASSPGSHVATDSWTPLAAGTDYTAHANLTVTMETAGDVATVTIANSGAARSFDLQIRGIPLVSADPFDITTNDQDSIDEHGLYEYTFPAPWLSTAVDVSSNHGFILRVFGQPAERLRVRFLAHYNQGQSAARDISERVTVKRRNTEYDYFIESVGSEVRGQTHYLVYTLSPAGVYGSVIILDQGPPLGRGILAP